MRAFTIIACVGVLGVSVLGLAMANTNPSQARYEEYAVERLTEYLKSSVCKKTTNLLENLIQMNCDKLVDVANPRIREVISIRTQKQDFILFSVYRTDLKLNNWIPSYKFETVGALDNFYTYSAQKQ
ncbi:hypothetical protein NIES4073_32840 [Kalymmatonema gypsitolerans NIES-4073]|jgi:hypothetical protein|uniref:DUF4359 domain-containing protein n=1 Tax=unclassified Scytonema TaxID=2618749 RepID=UPI0009364C4F|nr:DUF4359 domain-containing protein [Scytonema sp. HK-05]OKH58857.1 hypothetical protein NIES2130_12235 [Scytonema sp. HK-05]BAY48144.1 hypothetical protein SAMD00079811_57630 [Scytonema sp. HK-05]BAZ22402.1 hypothetical protein NIES4073_32840 [Scytonema sp. NIES-4073]